MLAALLGMLPLSTTLAGSATGPGSPTAPLTFLPITPLGARCLSGSPFGFYHVPAVNASSTKWTVYLQGGGFCLNEASCWSRAHQKLGNSSFFPPRSECICMNGVVGYDGSCHCLYLPYCDGASFSGFREKPWPINASNPKGDAVYFRGLANLDDTLDCGALDVLVAPNPCLCCLHHSLGAQAGLCSIHRLPPVHRGAPFGSLARAVLWSPSAPSQTPLRTSASAAPPRSC